MCSNKIYKLLSTHIIYWGVEELVNSLGFDPRVCRFETYLPNQMIITIFNLEVGNLPHIYKPSVMVAQQSPKLLVKVQIFGFVPILEIYPFMKNYLFAPLFNL